MWCWDRTVKLSGNVMDRDGLMFIENVNYKSVHIVTTPVVQTNRTRLHLTMAECGRESIRERKTNINFT